MATLKQWKSLGYGKYLLEINEYNTGNRLSTREFLKDVMSGRCQVELNRDKSAPISFRGGGEKSWALEVREQTQSLQTWQSPKTHPPSANCAV